MNLCVSSSRHLLALPPASPRFLRWYLKPPPHPWTPTVRRKLEHLAATDVPTFMCHWYNVYFAHTAGGLMIGRAVSAAVLDGAELAFYQYGGQDPKEIGAPVKEAINAIAEGWDADARARSVAETRECFKAAGGMMSCITRSCDCDCAKD